MSEHELIAEARRLASFAPEKPESVHDVVCAGFNALYETLRTAADNPAISNELVGALTRKVIDEALAGPDTPADSRECPYCDGRGWTIRATHASTCDGDCGSDCPVPEQEQCATCGGSGTVPADSQETLTVWWWPKGLGVSYDIPVPYEKKLDAPSALAFAEQLSRVEGMQFVKVFGSSERDIRWRYPADSQEDKT